MENSVTIDTTIEDITTMKRNDWDVLLAADVTAHWLENVDWLYHWRDLPGTVLVGNPGHRGIKFHGHDRVGDL